MNLRTILRSRGVCWWEPEWIAGKEFGSAWENLTWFDERGEALPVPDAIGPRAPRTGR